jgi:hypothetical protein
LDIPATHSSPTNPKTYNINSSQVLISVHLKSQSSSKNAIWTKLFGYSSLILTAADQIKSISWQLQINLFALFLYPPAGTTK